ncbi:MAG: hypothetical protein K6G58_02640 [Lachnospiraceae bacterium]|nr:hypothetical protein [Lachnospiraceae bacterium]
MRIKRSAGLAVVALAAILVSGCTKNADSPSVSNGLTDTQANIETDTEAEARTNAATNIQTNTQTGVRDVLEQGMAAADDGGGSDTIQTEPSGSRTEEKPENAADTEGIDIDLTALSATMVYSEVYNMMYYPENYVGKTVKMRGTYAVFHDETTHKYYHGCIIADATACCSQGIEFSLTDDYSFPEDYPSEGEEFTVVGTFEIYDEGESTYCTLMDAKLC